MFFRSNQNSFINFRFKISETGNCEKILTISIVDISDDCQWKLVAYNQFGEAESSCRLTVTRKSVTGKKPIFKTPLKNITTSECANLKLDVRVDSTPVAEMTW